MPRDSGAISDTLRPGVNVTIGYDATVHLFQNSTIRKVDLLSVDGREFFGPEAMSAHIRRWRSMAFIISAIGIVTALYNIVALFRSRIAEVRV